jgi:sigma54-dependent transcription regulator
MSKWNNEALKPEIEAVTQAWVKREAPIVMLYGPSGAGKTRLCGSLFEHSIYTKVLAIDLDNGLATISKYTRNGDLCDLQLFADFPEKRAGFWNKSLAYARKANVNAIIVEGFMAIYSGMVATRMEAITDDPEGSEARAAHAPAANRAGGMIQQLRDLKQYRLAAKTGCPIIVTLNTREIGKVGGVKSIVPDVSPNLADKFKRVSDAFIEVTRTYTEPSISRMLTQPTVDNQFRKLRGTAMMRLPTDGAKARDAATLVQQQENLNLPGLLALWAAVSTEAESQVSSIVAKHTTGAA